MKNLKSNPMKALALALVLVLTFSMTTFASQIGEDADSSDDIITTGEVDTAEDEPEEPGAETPAEDEVDQEGEAVLTDEIITELEAAGIEVSPYALTANISSYDELLTVLSFPVFEGVVILNDIQFDDVINLDRDFTFSAASGLESATLYSAEGERHFILANQPFSVDFENIILDGNKNGGGIEGRNNSQQYISGLTIQNCNNEEGGGLYANAINVSDCIFKNNEGTRGGALRVGGTSTIDTCNIINNTANSGGGIYVWNSSAGSGKVSISNTNIENNAATFEGGGLYCTSIYSFNVSDCLVQNNGAANNGGGLNIGSKIASVINCKIISNQAGVGDRTPSGAGGGISSSSELAIKNSVISENIARTNGGGINANQLLSIEDCEITNNTSQKYGGGLSISSYASSTPTLIGILIEENTALNGGGLYINRVYDGNELNFQDLTIVNNTATTNGGGIFTNAPIILSMNNSMINDNIANSYGGGFYIQETSDISLFQSELVNNRADKGSGIYFLDKNESISNFNSQLSNIANNDITSSVFH